MIIHEPEISKSGGRVRISAAVEAKHPEMPRGERLWFEFDEEFSEGVSLRSDAFALAGCAFGIRIHEDVDIRGEVSPLLLNGLNEWVHVWKSWWSDAIRIINVRATSTAPFPAPAGRGSVGVGFSGGVDSFYTLLRHSAGAEPHDAMRVTHALMVNGYDLDLDLEERGHFRTIRRIYEPVLKSLDVKLLVVRTNMMMFNRGLRRNLNFALLLTAPVLALGGMFRLFYLANSREYAKLLPSGSHPMVDHLFGTESLRVIHDGATLSRSEKIAALVDREETFATLRVCRTPTWNNVDVERQVVANCGLCGKCVRTMVSLKLLGALDRYSTFVRPLQRSAVRRSECRGMERSYAVENLRRAISRRDHATAFDLRWQIMSGYLSAVRDRLVNPMDLLTRLLYRRRSTSPSGQR